MCRFFEAEGKCPYGTDCTFAHAPEELKATCTRERRKTRPCLPFFQVWAGNSVVFFRSFFHPPLCLAGWVL